MHSISISDEAAKQIRRLDKPIRERIRKRIRELAKTPRPAGAKRLRKRPDWRIRVGDYRIVYRIVYRIEDQELVVLVVKVGHRKDVYQGL